MKLDLKNKDKKELIIKGVEFDTFEAQIVKFMRIGL